MSDRYVINTDMTISLAPDGAKVDRPWFVSLTAAAVHSGARVTCFTKEGVRKEAFPNPLPDPNKIDLNAFPDRRHYFVQMTEDGVLHSPPLMPEQAAEWTRLIVTEEPLVFDYDADNVVPEI